MKLNAYSLYDVKALQYHTPFYQSTDGAATRMLLNLVEDPNSMIGRHPADFRLYCVGVWDDGNGVFECISPPVHIVDAIALVRVDKQLPLQLVAKEA